MRQIFQRIWVRVTAFGVLGVIVALSAAWLSPFLPEDLGKSIGAGSVEAILKIIASSMLTVTTFSLSIMVTAFGSAQTGATPRAISLLQSDSLTQQVMASFMGAFIYALVGIIALETGYYGDAGQFVLFIATIGVIALIVAMLLRWIQHLSEFGRLDDTITRVEEATRAAMRKRCETPLIGGATWQAISPGAWRACAHRTGHVQVADMAKLQSIAQEQDCRIWLCAPPGAFVHPAEALVCCDALPMDAQARVALEEALRDAFVIAHVRSYDQDPTFGLRALAEIGSRALSPAVNDPGTGIDIMGRLLRVLGEWTPETCTQPQFDRVLVPALTPQELITNAYDALARDGAAQLEVAQRLQLVLNAAALVKPELCKAAAKQARRAADHAAAALTLPEDIAKIEALARKTEQLTQ
ncbi:hypothetical protein BFP70_03630 [Thioclava sp. SK-1]|nr:hypothetical protein BFP70_03630 [Thioclava sp. SK-1]